MGGTESKPKSLATAEKPATAATAKTANTAFIATRGTTRKIGNALQRTFTGTGTSANAAKQIKVALQGDGNLVVAGDLRKAIRDGVNV